MATLSFHDIRVNYRETGSGRDIVLLHSSGASGAQWREVAEMLSGEFRSITPDLLGHGRTPPWPEPPPVSHDIQADLVNHLISEICDGPVFLVGHSYGGATALRLAIRAPDMVKRLVLIEPAMAALLDSAGEDELVARFRRRIEPFVELARAGRPDEAWRRFLNHRNGPGHWEGLSDKAQDEFISRTEIAIAGFQANLHNPTTLADCRSVRVPTLILCGGDTTDFDRRTTLILKRELPCAAYAEIPGAGHMAPLTHPDAVAQAISSHMSD